MIEKMWAARASAVDTTRHFGAHWRDRLPGNGARRVKPGEAATRVVRVQPGREIARASTAMAPWRPATAKPVPMARMATAQGYARAMDWMPPLGRRVDIYA